MKNNDIPHFDRNATLFVSDLDGTLLGKGAEFPEGKNLPQRINALTDKGVRLTYATARTIQSAKDILAGITFTAPVALMNGVLIRDMNRGEYLRAAYLTVETASFILEKMEEQDIRPFVYSLHDGQLSTSYTKPINRYMRAFIDERVRKYNKPFTLLDRITDAVTGENSVIYVVAIDTYDALHGIHRTLSADRRLKCAFYRDSYEPDLWYLEVFSASASKGAAVRCLKEMTGAETVVVFGDNGNDLPMFAESDFSAAVENASEEVRAAADIVIGSAESGGVVDFIETHMF